VTISVQKHRLVQARWVPSPNYNERPSPRVDMLVVHNISLPPNEFSGPYVEAFFCNQLDCRVHPYFDEIKDLQVSAHLFIKRSGDIIQFVGFDQRAWHAGLSEWQGETNCNDFSIGIELEGADHIPYDAAQYEALAKVTKALQKAYPSITDDRIVGHSDIAPGRKTDPGDSFDWAHYRQLLERL